MEENMFCELELDSSEVVLLMEKLKKYIGNNDLEKLVLEKIISIEYEPGCQYYVELHMYELDPLIKYILKEIDNIQTNKKEKMVLSKIINRLHALRKQFEHKINKSLNNHQRYLIMLDDLEKR